MFKINPLYLTDGYKVGHKAMLAPGTTKLYGTWIPRSIKYAPKGITKIISFGQQLTWRYIHDVFEEHFFFRIGRNLDIRQDRLLKSKALQFIKDISLYLGMDYNGKHFEELWDLGYLPIKVKSLPEGIETLPNIPHMTFVNTVDGFAWLTLYLETIVSSLAWKPSTSATIAKLYRRQAEKWVNKTDPEKMWLVDYICHDFSARGLNPHDMIASGLGHATSFRGSDTLAVIPAARYYYGEPDNEVCINSVNASEHSVSCTKIFTVGEQQMLADWLQIFPKGILSIVADTFDLWKLITEYLPANKKAIMARDGKLVIRPDSGDPVDIICGTNYETIFFKEDFTGEEGDIVEFEEELYQAELIEDGEFFFNKIDKIKTNNINTKKGVIELLWDIFGGTVNEQGYKVLDPHIGAIYGDSITPDRQREIYERLASKGFAATNIVLGVGSFTYQYNTRDTLGFAAKGAWFEVLDKSCTENECEGGCIEKWHPESCKYDKKVTYDIYKDPVTDEGTKKSLKGLQAVYKNSEGEYYVKGECTVEEEKQGYLQTIYEDGKFYNQISLTEIREKNK